jgi:hypothetical protein
MNEDHPVRFSVDYQDRPVNRLTTAFRIFTVIPIVIVLGAIGGYSGGGGYDGGDGATTAIGGIGLLFLPPLPMIVFRQSTRAGAHERPLPLDDDQQWVKLHFPYPDAQRDLNRWLPLVKWLLAIPHYIVLFFLYLATIVVLIAALSALRAFATADPELAISDT